VIATTFLYLGFGWRRWKRGSRVVLRRIIDKRLRALEAKNPATTADENENGEALAEALREFEEYRRTGKPMTDRGPIDPDHPMAAILAVFLD
jgi:hypothetical protein